MIKLRITLMSDGSSDRALLPILRWLLLRAGVSGPIDEAWADFRRLPRPPRDLVEKISTACRLYPAELLFIHRDAERSSFDERKREILRALGEIRESVSSTTTICVVPVRMQEAWLLIDEMAIRWAAGNPNGAQPIRLPKLTALETLPDPKKVLHQLLREASGLKGKRLKQFRPHQHAARVGDYLADCSALLALPAFRSLVEDVQSIVDEKRWATRHSETRGHRS